jgi:lipopolysaccharide assembly outer membrane protein LptD (OstA)
MDKKKSLQFSLVVLLILSSVIFYKKFFEKNLDLTEENLIEKKMFNENSDDNTKNSNVVETLKYTSQDLIGNTYVIDAESAKFERDGKENIILFKVYAEIIRQDTETIKIYSDTANYNKKNNDTVFKKAVNIEYGDQTIKAEEVKLNFSENFIEIIENVYYMNKDTKMYADKVELDLLKKKMKITMHNQNDDIQITGKY